MNSSENFDPTAIERPDPALFRYYLWISLLTGPLTPLVLMPLWFRYLTLRYKFDESGVSMRWGILFRKEVYLTYRRIQDIHLTRNLLQRWMGLAKISLQTASGNSQAEMAVEGVLQADELRDYLYSRMRGAKSEPIAQPTGAVTLVDAAGQDVAATANEQSSGQAANDRATRALEEIRDALQRLVSAQRSSGGAP